MKFGKFGITHGPTAEEVSQENLQNTSEIGSDGIARMFLVGKVDASCFMEIQNQAMELLESPEVVGLVFDMKNVSYVSSAGLRMFSAVHKKAISSNKSYKLTQIRGDILKLFQLTGYASAFCLEVQSEE